MPQAILSLRQLQHGLAHISARANIDRRLARYLDASLARSSIFSVRFIPLALRHGEFRLSNLGMY